MPPELEKDYGLLSIQAKIKHKLVKFALELYKQEELDSFALLLDTENNELHRKKAGEITVPVEKIIREELDWFDEKQG